MILIGQYDSPFVRRVGIALTLYDLPFEHRPWSSFSEAEKIRAYNPLTRVPTLVLDDGAVLVDSHLMLDYLDSLVPPERAMFPAREPARHRALKVAGLATGLADKAVSLFYEKRLHAQVSEVWADRCRTQMSAALAALETDRAARPGPYWFGDRIWSGRKADPPGRIEGKGCRRSDQRAGVRLDRRSRRLAEQGSRPGKGVENRNR